MKLLSLLAQNHNNIAMGCCYGTSLDIDSIKTQYYCGGEKNMRYYCRGRLLKTEYYLRQILKSQCLYSYDRLNKTSIYYHDNGNKKYIYNYKNNKKHGVCTHYTEDGKKNFEFLYNNDYNYSTIQFCKDECMYLKKKYIDKILHEEYHSEFHWPKGYLDWHFCDSVRKWIGDYKSRGGKKIIIRYYCGKNKVMCINFKENKCIKYGSKYNKNGYLLLNNVKIFYKNKKIFFY